MQTHRVAVIGTGDPDADGYAMGYYHADAYEGIDGCELVACADIVPENARMFAEEYDLDEDGVYDDHRDVLAEVEPDVVSVTVPPMVHADVVVDCLHADAVRAVHCEKPMAYRWDDCRRMAEEARANDTILAFNHQRRFGRPFREAKRLLDDGEIGALQRVEFEAPGGLFYDYGSHSIDMCNYFTDEERAEWVMGQLEYTEENLVFGAHNANRVMTMWEYENGVHGVGTSGLDDSIGAHNRLVGTDGTIEVGPHDADCALRIRRDGEGWETIGTDGEGLHSWTFLDRAVADTVGAVDEGYEPELRADNALNATEILFATYESARSRKRIETPLEVDGNPLVEMVESGELSPASGDE